MQQLTIFDDLDSMSAEYNTRNFIDSLMIGDFIELDTIKKNSRKFRFHSIKKGDKREFLVYDREFVNGSWKEYNPFSGGFWGIELDKIIRIIKLDY